MIGRAEYEKGSFKITLPYIEKAKSLMNIDHKIANQDQILFFTIKTIPDNELTGTICLWKIDLERKYAEVGSELLPVFQGKGIMSESFSDYFET